VAAKDPELRRLNASIAAYARHAQVPRVHPPVVPAALRERYETEVDPASTLDPDLRRLRAYRAWQRDVKRAEARKLKALLGSGRPGGDPSDAA
jgi:hypothetical protein